MRTMKNKAAQQLGRLGGRVTSEAKAKAAKENGKKGGRPKKAKLVFLAFAHPAVWTIYEAL